MASSDLFVGSWILLPDLSLYEFGPMPASGSYIIAQTDTLVRVDMQWTLEEGQPYTMGFEGPTDGTPQPIEAPGVDAFTLTRVNGRTLDSEAVQGGRVVAYARRLAAADGRLLVVVQKGERPDGTKFQNYQVYKRAEDTA